jgi:hypothetical protein
MDVLNIVERTCLSSRFSSRARRPEGDPGGVPDPAIKMGESQRQAGLEPRDPFSRASLLIASMAEKRNCVIQGLPDGILINCDLSLSGLPDGIFSYQKSQFGYFWRAF